MDFFENSEGKLEFIQNFHSTHPKSFDSPSSIADIVAQIEQRIQRDRTTKVNSRLEFNERQNLEEKRQQNIRSVIASKINEMRDARIPESIVRDVERQLDLSII